MEQNVNSFDKLAKSLSDNERKKILDKIQNKESMADETVSAEKLTNKQRHLIMAQNEMKKLSFLDKFILKITAFITGKNVVQYLIEKKLQNLQMEIKRSNLNIIDFSKDTFTPYFLEIIKKLAKVLEKAREVFACYIQDTTVFEHLIIYLVEKYLNEQQKQFLKQTEPDQNFFTDLKLTDEKIQKEKSAHFNKFISSLNGSQFSSLELQVNNLYILWKLIEFPFNNIINCNLVLYPNDREKQNQIKWTAIQNDFIYLTDIFSNLLISSNKIVIFDDLKNFTYQNDSANITPLSDENVKSLYALLRSLESFAQNIPFIKITSYFTKNLYYATKKLKPINLYEKYKTAKKKQINELWQNTTQLFMNNKLTEKINKFLPDFNFKSLTNFTEDICSEIIKADIKPFISIKRLNYIYQFLISHFQISIEPVINKLMVDGEFKREFQKKELADTYYLLKDKIAVIENFDLSFAEEEKDGKRLQFLLTKVKIDFNLKTNLKHYIEEKDGISNRICQETIEKLGFIKIYLAKMSHEDPGSLPFISNIFNLHYPEHTPIIKTIKENLAILEQFIEIYEFLLKEKSNNS